MISNLSGISESSDITLSYTPSFETEEFEEQESPPSSPKAFSYPYDHVITVDPTKIHELIAAPNPPIFSELLTPLFDLFQKLRPYLIPGCGIRISRKRGGSIRGATTFLAKGLPSTCFISPSGMVHFQRHRKNFSISDGTEVPSGDPGLFAEGGQRNVYLIDTHPHSEQYVRSVYKPGKTPSESEYQFHSQFPNEPCFNFSSFYVHVKGEVTDRLLKGEIVSQKEIRNQLTIISKKRDGNLYELVSRDCLVAQEFTYKDWLRIMLQMAYPLKVMHENGWIHRDLKLANYLFDKNPSGTPTVKLGDFGACVNQGLQPFITKAIGTPGHVDPRLYNASKQPVRNEPALDIWSLGLAFWQLKNKTPHPFSYKYVKRDDKWVKAFLNTMEQFRANGFAPKDELDKFIEKMIDPDPAKRPTIDEVIAFLNKELAN